MTDSCQMPSIPRDPNIAQRKIYFHTFQSPDGQADFSADRAAIVDCVAALHGTPRFYLQEGPPTDEQYLCAVVDRSEPPQRIRFYRVRRRNLPETEVGGVFEDLELEEARGLAESIHILLFDDTVIGSEYNHYGPRITTFASFLKERCNVDVRIRQLIRRDVIDEILAMRDVRVFRVKVAPSAATAVQQRAQGLGGAFDAAELFSAGHYMDLKLASGGNDEAFTTRVKTFFDRFRDPEAAAQLEAAQVYGKNRDGMFETLDLLKDRIVLARDIEREAPRSRALDKESAYRAVEDAYAEISDELGEAGSIIVES